MYVKVRLDDSGAPGDSWRHISMIWGPFDTVAEARQVIDNDSDWFAEYEVWELNTGERIR